ncbi:MAG: exo-alpha-sialidase [Chloroflexi bacterium]|nr:exo-alpha-sialidase [Chloroflexota bacterium]MCI0856312.1 exo-alpha-sialidase [Chloroflexota bacterium]MCI0889764.1 exo-alpha-sialidase [Chloroflexota bacterium]
MTTIRLIVGTKKGGFIYTSDEKREAWELSDPILPGWSVYHAEVDTRSTPARFYLAANHWAWGPSVARSTDLKDWDFRSPGLAFPEDLGIVVQNVWNVCPGPDDQPGVVYAGTQPAGLFRSDDWGETWASVDGLNRHEYRQYWGWTGVGQSCLHSIEIDPRNPRRFFVSISSGYSYVTQDGGDSWEIRAHRVIPKPETRRLSGEQAAQLSNDFEPEEKFTPPIPPGVDPAAENEMHKLRIDPKNPDRLWGQAHVGVYRSDNGGDSWEDVTKGLPSFFGFPIAIARREPDAVFVVPLAFERDNFRVVDGQFAVYRTRDAGTSWERLTDGLPGPHSYQSVYREGLDTDGLDQEGVYVGTSNGQVFASNDGGDHWQRLPGDLPPILSVTCAVTE